MSKEALTRMLSTDLVHGEDIHREYTLNTDYCVYINVAGYTVYIEHNDADGLIAEYWPDDISPATKIQRSS